MREATFALPQPSPLFLSLIWRTSTSGHTYTYTPWSLINRIYIRLPRPEPDGNHCPDCAPEGLILFDLLTIVTTRIRSSVG